MVILYYKVINTIEGNKAGSNNKQQKGLTQGCWGRNVTENVTFEPRLEEDEEGSHVILGRRLFQAVGTTCAKVLR